MSNTPLRVLFVCTSNSARSIMAEAVLRKAGGSGFEARSAGTEPSTVHPLAARVLDEAGLDRTGLRSKSVDEFRGEAFDYVITLCDDARLVCPVFPGADQSLHWGYSDPAGVGGSEADRVAAFQRVLTQIGERVRQFVVVAGRGATVRAGEPA